jgi:hypothetical protein
MSGVNSYGVARSTTDSSKGIAPKAMSMPTMDGPAAAPDGSQPVPSGERAPFVRRGSAIRRAAPSRGPAPRGSTPAATASRPRRLYQCAQIARWTFLRASSMHSVYQPDCCQGSLDQRTGRSLRSSANQARYGRSSHTWAKRFRRRPTNLRKCHWPDHALSTLCEACDSLCGPGA